MANFITCVRIVLSAALLSCPALSAPFYALYLAAGLSDMIDGAVARKTGTADELGARLDTVADFVFAAVCLIKLLPVISLPSWLYVWIGAIAFIRGLNIACGYVIRKRFVAMHTIANKATGALLFILPLSLSFMEVRHTAVIVYAVATFAAIQEGHLIRTGAQD